jgi:phosphomannomutase
MISSRRPQGPMRLTPAIKPYAWGDRVFIPNLLGMPEPDAPCAEAWFGAHPQGPATVILEGTEVGLDGLMAEYGEDVLGPRVDAAFSELPYLLKILAAGEPLSIQVHPSRTQAEAGFDQEEAAGIARDAPHRSYRDRNPKPEILVALTEFHALCGFRPYAEIAAFLESVPALSALLPKLEPGSRHLATWVEAYLALPEGQVGKVLEDLLAACRTQNKRKALSVNDPAYWALHAHEALGLDEGPDRGLLFVFFLNLLHLAPGQGMFLPAGVPHAYLRGAGVEVMASSDNVLRAGLTPKHVNPGELVRVVRFDAGLPRILDPVEDGAGEEGVYAIPAAEFDLRRIQVQVGRSTDRLTDGPETLLFLPDDPNGVLTVSSDLDSLTLRRGEACLLPHGVRYHLSSTGLGTVFRILVPGGPMLAPTFRGRTPKELGFGTSGLRGLVSDITDLEAYVQTSGFLEYLVARGDAVPGTKVWLAGDLRPSTHGEAKSILSAVCKAVQETGLVPVYAGLIPTPALTYAGLCDGCPSIMVTGSHIPFDRNGIKFNTPTGEVLKEDEPGIRRAVQRVRARVYGCSAQASIFDDQGTFRAGHKPSVPLVDDSARSMYARRYLDAIEPSALSGLRIGLYAHSAVGRDILNEILTGLGAEVFEVGRSEVFVPIDTEAVTHKMLKELQQMVTHLMAKVGRIDALVSTDGDSDRPLLLAVDADGRIRFVTGDQLGTLVAEALQADFIAVPVSTSDLIDTYFDGRPVEVLRTRIGSPWVIAAMSADRASVEASDRRVVGFEANGGFLVGSPVRLSGGVLERLPTRDAVLPLVVTLAEVNKTNAGWAGLLGRLPKRFGRSGLLDDVLPRDTRALERTLGLRRMLLRKVRFEAGQVWTVDLAGLEEVAPEEVASACRELRKKWVELLAPSTRLETIDSIDCMDGIRVRFENGEVIHVRPSGNAPQLRAYVLADSEARADALLDEALREPDGLLRRLLVASSDEAFVAAIRRNIRETERLFHEGHPSEVLGAVSGSEQAQVFWQSKLDAVRSDFKARKVVSLHEDLPVNQAFGLLLMWQRLRPVLEPGEGALMAFVFGEGSRAAPLTEAECGQKPAIASFVRQGEDAKRRSLSVVELALRYFALVESHLRRSGFDGVVVKWGDEVQIPTLDLSGTDELFQDADVVRFVSLRAMTQDDAVNKDWVGVDDAGQVTAFIPRRPLGDMEALFERGLLQKRDGKLFGGINLGSIAVSRKLLDVLLEAFHDEVNDPQADRNKRPDLDPQLFTALTLARIEDPAERAEAYRIACAESPAMAKLEANLPAVLDRLRNALETFQVRHGRKVRMVAMDFQDQYWGDIGQHRQMYEVYMALLARGVLGQVARAIAGISEDWDEQGNLLVGDTVIGPGANVQNSVLIDAHVEAGTVCRSVLVGTHAHCLDAEDAFDIESTVTSLHLSPRSGSYKVVSNEAVAAQAGERITSVFLPDEALLLRVHEGTDLRDRKLSYVVPILDNSHSFESVHRRVLDQDPDETERLRARARGDVQKTR